ncbi:uncharacterized protein EKO05_0004078 [Ascochyta rabiei]|uniref:uncharacterized protein n=1 Tax=Didymella rabiei TaxID=5454 RepID=UPI002207FAF2|nr:uncharacterized protein EKO05_0004078 [Ascochyta rabiei]UPX13575.1 hypothetical protein EKO05_0004078 [Ascochyta rabiei]
MMQKTTTLSARENEILALAWQCFEADPKVNMEKLAGLSGGKCTPQLSNPGFYYHTAP